MVIPRSFYERPTLDVARDLIGQILVRETAEGIVSGVIVETEAYLGEVDDAAHSYRGKSERVRVQYGEKGRAYVYMIYGMYYCLNITTGPPGVPEVVLIRAVEPVSGIELMARRRGVCDPFRLCSGPGRLCQAFAIAMPEYGADMCEKGGLYLEYGKSTLPVLTSKRIGVEYAVKTRDMPWRFFADGSPFVSRAPGRARRNRQKD